MISHLFRVLSCFKGSNAAATTAMLLSVSFYVIVSTLPATLVYVLEDQFREGPHNMTDEQISKDSRWQRYFQYIAVRKVVEEVRSSFCAFEHYESLLVLRGQMGSSLGFT